MEYLEKLNLLYYLSRTFNDAASHLTNGDIVAYKACLDQAGADLAYIMANETVEPTKSSRDVHASAVRTFEISFEDMGDEAAEAFRVSVSKWMATNGDLAFLITSKTESDDALEAENVALEGGE